MTNSEPTGRMRPDDGEEMAVLRGKYLDYCSAQLADLLLYLSPDEIYVLAEKAAGERGGDGPAGYMGMVDGATAWLSSRVSLPPFEVWVEDYEKNPEYYDTYLMGLWESEIKDSV